MARIIFKKEINQLDTRLCRNIHFDSESKRYAVNTAMLSIVSVIHNRTLGILDQGKIGSCTGHAGIGDLACAPLAKALPANPKYTLSYQGAVDLYAAAVKIDGGEYPPDDFGSSGLSISKALNNFSI